MVSLGRRKIVAYLEAIGVRTGSFKPLPRGQKAFFARFNHSSPIHNQPEVAFSFATLRPQPD